jgi:pyridinium-3,5-biscarboxylic acid mononucleotide sulfurtransferase
MDEKLARKKNEHLGDILRSMDKVLIAYSGGVDSAFLAVRAHQELGDNALCVIASSETFPTREFDAAVELAKEWNLPLMTTNISEFVNENFVANNPDRCYHCKSGLYLHLIPFAKEKGYDYISNGANMDDQGDYRPGMKAAMENGVRSPLQEAGLFKEEIRFLSKEMNLRTWNKPSFACLSSRIPYGTRITQDKIDQLDHAEVFLQSLGLYQVRVRHHGEIARIEIMPEEFPKVLKYHEEIDAELKKVGFSYITLDLRGYRTGSMNETILKSK